MKNLFTLLITFGLLALLAYPQSSDADWGPGQRAGHHGAHRYFRYHDHPHFGVHVAAFYPDEYFPVWVGGSRYYYDDGVYYNNVDGNYVVIAPPVGAIVSTIPSDFQPVSINGVTYYVDNGAYYVHTPNGYQVVSQPVQTASVNASGVVTVNVPSNRGGYVAVTLRRSGNGYLGPGRILFAIPQ